MTILNNTRYHKTTKEENKRNIRELIRLQDQLIDELTELSKQTNLKLDRIAN